MKKINFSGISEILSEKELKNVMGGSGRFSCSGLTCTCHWIHLTETGCCSSSSTSDCIDYASDKYGEGLWGYFLGCSCS